MARLSEMPTICDSLSGEVRDNIVELYDCHGYEPTRSDLWAWFKNDLATLKENGFRTSYNDNEPPGKCQDAYYRIIVKE